MEYFMNLNIIVQALLATLFSYFMTALGASIVFFFKKVNNKVIDVMLGLSSGIMIAASFWSLLSPAIDLAEEVHNNKIVIPALGFLSGGLFIIISDILLGLKYKTDNESKKNILMVSAVTMHNIPEGMAIGVAFGSVAVLISSASLVDAIILSIGIAIQNFPEGACVAMPLRSNGHSRRKAFLIGQASGFVEIIAGLIGVVFALIVRSMLPFLLSFSAGAMIAVVCSELIPDAYKNSKIIATIGILIGFIIMMTLDVVLG